MCYMVIPTAKITIANLCISLLMAIYLILIPTAKKIITDEETEAHREVT